MSKKQKIYKMNELLKKIKGRGYWMIRFRPLSPKPSRIVSLEECDNLVQRTIVKLRGWDYPHYPRREEITFGNSFIEGFSDWENHIELWRMYQSGQFIHYLALREDWFENDSWRKGTRLAEIKQDEVIDVIGAVYTITEIFEFLARLTKERIYDDGVRVNIEFHNTRGRKLDILDSGRVPLMFEYSVKIPSVIFQRDYNKQQVADGSSDLALEIIREFFLRFGWRDQPLHVFKNDQEKFLKKLI